jgi:predicted CXXCH cytochrome family protein
VWKAMEFQHGPVAQGNCTACHNPHGSDNPLILSAIKKP